MPWFAVDYSLWHKTVRMQIGDTLEEFLLEATDDSKLRQVLMSLSEAVRTIAFKVSRKHVSQLFLSYWAQPNAIQYHPGPVRLESVSWSQLLMAACLWWLPGAHGVVRGGQLRKYLWR